MLYAGCVNCLYIFVGNNNKIEKKVKVLKQLRISKITIYMLNIMYNHASGLYKEY